MKKAVCFCLSALLCLALSACGTAGAETKTPSSPAAAAEAAPGPASWEEECTEEEAFSARAAYSATLEILLNTGVLPDGTGLGTFYPPAWDKSAMAKNQFAVCDVDRDGREELILLYNTSTMADMRGYVLAWDAEAEELRTQLHDFPDFTFYESGAAEAGWSHNQGKGGRFWPYNLYRYDAYTDSYVEVGAVDAWDKSLGLQGYPDALDTSGSGFVYYICTNGSFSWDDPLDESVYLAWRYPYVQNSAELEINYLPLTEENIRSLITPAG